MNEFHQKYLDEMEVRDESTEEEIRYQLYVKGGRRAAVTCRRGSGKPIFHWQIYGPERWFKAQALIEGLLELSVLAAQLEGKC